MNFRKNDCDNCESSAHTLSVIAAVAGVLGLAYIGYRNKDCIDWKKVHDFGDRAKNRLTYVFEPAQRGWNKTKNRASDLREEATDEIKDSFQEMINNLDIKIQSLSGDSKTKYEKQLKQIKDLRNELSNNR